MPSFYLFSKLDIPGSFHCFSFDMLFKTPAILVNSVFRKFLCPYFIVTISTTFVSLGLV